MTLTSQPPVALHGTWRTYTTADGLASLRAEHITEDHDGYLWFATDGGVSLRRLAVPAAARAGRGMREGTLFPSTQ